MKQVVESVDVEIQVVTNMFGIKVKRMCASCQHKCIQKDGTRFCANMMLKVEQKFVCNQWEMSDGMKNAGLGGGVVRLRGRNEEVINVEH